MAATMALLLAWRSSFEFVAVCRIDTPVEIEYFKNSGILHTVIRKKLNESKQFV